MIVFKLISSWVLIENLQQCRKEKKLLALSEFSLNLSVCHQFVYQSLSQPKIVNHKIIEIKLHYLAIGWRNIIPHTALKYAIFCRSTNLWFQLIKGLLNRKDNTFKEFLVDTSWMGWIYSNIIICDINVL